MSAVASVIDVQASKTGFEEYDTRAAFLLAFGKYTEWPTNLLNDAFVIGVLGDDAFGTAIGKMDLGKLGNRKVVVKRFLTAFDVEPCQILYFPSSEERHLSGMRAKLAAGGVLTVGESSRFLGLGGAIHLYLEGGRPRFEVNRAVLDQSRLRMEAKALNLAKKVISQP